MHLSIDYSGLKGDVLDKLESEAPADNEKASAAERSAAAFERSLRDAVAAHVDEHAADGQVAVNIAVHARFRNKPAKAPAPTPPADPGKDAG